MLCKPRVVHMTRATSNDPKLSDGHWRKLFDMANAVEVEITFDGVLLRFGENLFECLGS